MAEIWKDIEGYEGLYQVSNEGNVKSLEREVEYLRDEKVIKQKLQEKILKPYTNGSGYFFVVLCKNSKTKNITIHRLVAEAFIPNPKHKPQIDHINTIKTDNNVENLCWVTAEENLHNQLTVKNRFLSKGQYRKKHYNRLY